MLSNWHNDGDDGVETYRCSLPGSLGCELLTGGLAYREVAFSFGELGKLLDDDRPPVDLRAVCCCGVNVGQFRYVLRGRGALRTLVRAITMLR
jgi:hypothetical protein